MNARNRDFFAGFEQVKAFAGISAGESAIDYLLGAYLLFPRLQAIPDNYWLAPADWRLKTLPKTSMPMISTYSVG